ncbi:hypothetical protein [Nesterenkonia ebinurensis]|uniref:hypothetical protein n=1 Tax=Nesterenkonia ebinurensis TaxID=2608252 RepID=UPI00123E20DE|nr:hypothetical protein [Nesterenkonia ebinurensis]
MGRIATIYELEMKVMVSASALAQLAAQMSGQALARSFIKHIRGAGSAVNTTVASANTRPQVRGGCDSVKRSTPAPFIDITQVT